MTLSLKKLSILLFGFLLFLPVKALAVTFVDGLQVEGNKKAETQTILATIETKEGMTFSPERIRHDIQALYNLGLFRNIEVIKKPGLKRAGGVLLVYRVEEKKVLSKISFKGNKKIKEKELREELKIKLFQVLDSSKVAEGIQKMKEQYAEKGYHLAEITTELQEDEKGGGQELIFHVSESQGIRIKKISFIGNKAFS
ncbi:MAG: POTRA domain-containing protein, partial [bacterium]|nr:POTRA domain-containing protein [bacterium]